MKTNVPTKLIDILIDIIDDETPEGEDLAINFRHVKKDTFYKAVERYQMEQEKES